jgi:hypothetical protein
MYFKYVDIEGKVYRDRKLILITARVGAIDTNRKTYKLYN